MHQVLSFLQTVCVMGIVLGFMILIHEFGHYAAAKFFKVRVEVFSIGFGKRLLGFRKGETDYRISALPLGGYVKMSGENPMDERTGDAGEFLSHPKWQRFIIAIAGPAMNILLAFGLWTGVFMVHFEYPAIYDGPAEIGWILPNTPAAKAGIQIGDRIVRVDGIENPTWEQVGYKELLSPNQPLKFDISRNGTVSELTLVPQPAGRNQVGDIGWVPKEPSFIATLIEPGMPAEKAGIKPGDRIISVNGQQIPSLLVLVDMLSRTKDQPLDILVERSGQPMTFHVTPTLKTGQTPEETRYRIGLGSAPPTKVVHLPFADAVRKSALECKKNSLLIVELLQKMVERKISIKQVDGPIGIGSAVGTAFREEGWWRLLFVSAIISLNLGVFNLMPIPILDGGVILLLFIEGLMQKEISLRIKERIYQAAFVFLVLFAVTVIYNDIIKQLPGAQ
ncbi:MAG TPA: site-2 protease family protein [Terriglobales bacterium]|jgi:regulator of sigma E protease|nr:site-2 protease family protein [Terriglobales bacterium]